MKKFRFSEKLFGLIRRTAVNGYEFKAIGRVSNCASKIYDIGKSTDKFVAVVTLWKL